MEDDVSAGSDELPPADTVIEEQWETVPADPAPGDLGYDRLQVESYQVSDGSGRRILLPADEEMLQHESAFVVAEENCFHQLDEWR